MSNTSRSHRRQPARRRVRAVSTLVVAGAAWFVLAAGGADAADPESFDCSELVRWSSVSSAATPTAPTTLATTAAETGGRPSSAHVAISLGDGRTVD